MRNTISTLLLLALLSLSAYSQPSSSSGPYQLTLAKWQAVLSGTKTASYIVDGSGACRALVSADIPDLLATYAAASHTHAASAITSGTIATARLGSGTADSTTYLRGDNTWATPSSSLSSITSGTLATTLALGTQVVTSTGSPTWYTATGQSIKLGVVNPLLSLGSDGTTQGNYSFLLGGSPGAGYAGIYTSGTTLITQALSGSYATVQVGGTSQEVARFGNNGSASSFRNFIIGTTNPSSGYPYIAGDASNISIASVSTSGIIKFILGVTEIGRVGPTIAEFNRLSLGGTIGSSTDPGAGSIAAVGNVSLGGTLTFTSTGSPTASKPQIWTTGPNFDLCLNAPSGRSISAYISGSSLLFNLGWADNAYGSTRFSLGLFGSGTYSGTAANSGIASTGSTSLDSNVATGGSITSRVNNVTKLTVDGSRITCANVLNIPTATPASNGTGTTGDIAWDADYLYVCTGTNTWKRAALTGGY